MGYKPNIKQTCHKYTHSAINFYFKKSDTILMKLSIIKNNMIIYVY